MIAQNDRVLEELTNTVAGKVAAFAAVLNSEITEELMPKLPFYYTSDFSVGETSGTSQIHETLGGHEALLADLSRRVERVSIELKWVPACNPFLLAQRKMNVPFPVLLIALKYSTSILLVCGFTDPVDGCS
jgi:hypothetical protein